MNQEQGEPMDQDEDQDEDQGPQFPSNPLDMSNLCTQHISDTREAHIYLLRYQTPDSIMSVITQYNQDVYNDLNTNVFNGGATGVIRLGYFKLQYTNGIMSAEVFDTNSIGPAINTMGGLHTLTTQWFNDAWQNRPMFTELVTALIHKAFVESFIQHNFRFEVNFMCFIALDLYAIRNPQQALLFHQDATDQFPTRLFTLTYLIEDPNIIVKGPTIVTSEPFDYRSAVTPAVRHGTTVGIDNTAVLHATPDTKVYIAMPGDGDINKDEPIPQQTSQFMLRNHRNEGHYEGPELATDINARKTQLGAIAYATRNTPRSFVRTWYNWSGFLGAPMSAPFGLDVINDDVVGNSINNIRGNTCFITTNVTPSVNTVLDDPRMRRASLGGRAESGVNYAQRTPLLEYNPLIGKEPQNASEQKSKPSIGDIFASAEFQKLAASTNNFILSAVVKDKDSELPMGGKQASWSEKGKKRAMRTSKRGKRYRTARRMGGRKKKTYRKTKHTKKRR